MASREPAELDPAADVRRIVVGVDGSPESDRALDWAIAEAKARGLVLDVVTAWLFPMTTGYAFTTTVHEVRQAAQAIIDRAIAHVVEIAPDVVVRGESTEQAPAPALVKASADAELLVVGSRGSRWIHRALAGLSESILHAPCPVFGDRHSLGVPHRRVIGTTGARRPSNVLASVAV